MVVARIAQIQSALNPPTAPSAPVQAKPGSSFAGMLTNAMGPGAVGTASPTAPIAGVSGGGARIVAAAAGEVGQAEHPPGSNDSPRIAMYRSATAGAPGPGAWCSYFASWACKHAGVPLADEGRGFGRVDDVAAWARRTGRWMPATATPQPGDLIVWDEHISIVQGVLPDGSIQTIEGNSSNQVAQRVHPKGDNLGFVRPG